MRRLRHPLTAISMLWGATASGAGLSFLTQVLLARELGPRAYGLFASSLATVSMVAPLAGFGLSSFWLKAYGAEGWNAERWLRPSLRFMTVSTVVTLAGVVVWSLLGAPADGTQLTLLVLLPVVLGSAAADLVSSKLRLEERHGALAMWQMMLPVGRLGVAVVVVAFSGLPHVFAAFGYAAVSLGMVALAVCPLHAMFGGGLRLRGHGARPAASTPSNHITTAQLWTQSWAFGMDAVLYPVFFQIGSVLMKYLAGDEQAGIFGIAVAILAAAYLLPTTVYQKFLLAKFHRWARHDPSRFWFVYRRGIVAMLAAGVAVGGAIAAAAPLVVPVAFGDQFTPVVNVLFVLALCPPIRFVSAAVGSVLLTERDMRARAGAMAVAAFAAGALGVALIPAFGVMGGAVSMVSAEATLLVMIVLRTRVLRRNGNAVVRDVA